MATSRICAIPDCGKPHRARGYCEAHYKTIIQKGYQPPTKPCGVDGCKLLARGRKYCLKHYKRFYKYGDPLAGSTYRGDAQKFLADVAKHTEKGPCLIWPYTRNLQGYGQIRFEKKLHVVSRLVCALVHGEPPTPKHEAAHLCGLGHEGCCNPHHLAWKTPSENQKDKVIHGTHNRGSQNPGAKFTKDQVAAIRKEAATSSDTYVSLARKHGVAAEVLRCLVIGKTYKEE